MALYVCTNLRDNDIPSDHSYPDILGIPLNSTLKADPDFTQDIAYIHEILHSNHFIILSNATAYEITSCLKFSGIAENDEVVAVEDFIDVGNILGKSWAGLWWRQWIDK